jgi:hypothetical protein
MSQLYDKIHSVESFLDKCQVIWDHYLERKLNSNLEPNWVHSGYELILKTLKDEKLSSEEQYLVREIVYTHGLPDGTFVPSFPGKPNSPMRMIHDGWKSGSSSWIFIGRNIDLENVKYLGEGWVLVQRTLPDEYYQFLDSDQAPPTLFMSYNLDKKMDLTSSTNNVIGPAVYSHQIIHAIQESIGHVLKKD